ncbi:MAG TPA: hypothetical protein V6C81_00880 [Planktothrix sp.]|jgi:hypothetical protein
MCKNRAAVLIACFACVIGFAPNSYARASAEQLQAAVIKAKVLPPGAKLTCVINSTELTASTYRGDQSTEKDCKIDALLVAKTAFDTDSELARAVVQFYDIRDPNTFYEVDVTVGDVAAYGSGKITQEQTLSALKLTRQSAQPVAGRTTAGTNTADAQPTKDAQQPAAPKGDEQKSDGRSAEISNSDTAVSTSTASADALSKPTSIASALPTAALKPTAPTPAATASGLTSYSNYGITFSYPSTWTPDPTRKGSTLLRFYAPGADKSPTIIEVQVYQHKSVSPTQIVDQDPRDTFEQDRLLSWRYTIPDMLRPAMIRGQAGFKEEDGRMYQLCMNQGKPSEYIKWKAMRRNSWSKLIPVALPATVKIGAKKNIAALQRATYMDEPMISIRSYMRAVAFPSSTFTILFGFYAPGPNAGIADKQLDDLLNTITVASTPAAAKHK